MGVGVGVCERRPPSAQHQDVLAVWWAPQFTRVAPFSVCPAVACPPTTFSTVVSAVAPQTWFVVGRAFAVLCGALTAAPLEALRKSFGSQGEGGGPSPASGGEVCLRH